MLIRITETNRSRVVKQLAEKHFKNAKAFADAHQYHHGDVLALVKQINHSFTNPLHNTDDLDNRVLMGRYVQRNPGTNQKDLSAAFHLSRPIAKAYIDLIYQQPYDVKKGTQYGPIGQKTARRIPLIQKLVREEPHLSMTAIAAYLDIPYSSVRQIIQTYNIPYQAFESSLMSLSTKDFQAMLDQYQGQSITQIAPMIGWSPSSLLRALQARPDVTYIPPTRSIASISDEELQQALEGLLPAVRKKTPFGIRLTRLAKVLGLTINQLNHYRKQHPIIDTYARPIQQVTYEEMVKSFAVIDGFSTFTRQQQANALKIPISTYMKWVVLHASG